MMLEEVQSTIRRALLTAKVEGIYKQSKSAADFKKKLKAFIKQHNATCPPEEKLGEWGAMNVLNGICGRIRARFGLWVIANRV